MCIKSNCIADWPLVHCSQKIEDQHTLCSKQTSQCQMATTTEKSLPKSEFSELFLDSQLLCILVC